MSSNDVLGLIIIAGVFLAGFVPLVMGIIYYMRENQRLDREDREKAQKAASHSWHLDIQIGKICNPGFAAYFCTPLTVKPWQ